jgi:2-amino-4-hydroxy-6-hydroxymethyldihydropteridine diphosphokinase
LSAAGNSSMHNVILGLGSNITPDQYLPKSVELLRELVRVVAVSTAWETPAVGMEGPDFLNAASLIQTPLLAERLKEQVIRVVEFKLDRIRTANKFAPRTIDLDILIFDGEIKYPNIWKYAYLAVPVAEITPELVHPETGETISQAAKRLVKTTRIEARPDILPGYRD